MSFVVITLDGQPQIADVVRENVYTLWVRLKTGEVIQRHKRKHDVGQVRDR